MNAKGKMSRLERRICHFVAQGYTNDEIAEELGTTRQVVKNVLYHVKQETGLNRVMLAIEIYKLEFKKENR